MQYLKADTVTEVTIGPAVAVGDGFTPVISLTIAGADEAEIIKHGATATTAIAGTLAAITGADGYYALDLSATDTDTEGRLTLLINDDSLILPIRMEFMVVAANVFDSLFAVAGTDLLQIDLTEIVGGAVPAPTTTGILDVNTERWADTLVTLSGALPDVNVEAMDAASIAAGTIAAAELQNIEDEIWDALKSAHVVANSFGDFLDVEVTSRLASADINLTAGAVDVVTAVTNAVTVGTINANVINAASIAAAAMNGKGDWNIGKTGYSLTQSFPTNFADLVIAAGTGELDVNVVEWLATAVVASTAGIPDVNAERIGNLANAASVLGTWMEEGIFSTADSGTTTTLVDASLSQGDDVWNDALLVFRTGANAGHTAVGIDFDDASNTLTFTPAVPASVTTEQYVLIPGLGRADIQAWLATVPNDLIAGAIDSDVSAMQAGTITAAVIATDAIDDDAIATGAIASTAFAAGAINAAAIATDAIGAAELASDAVDKIRDAILPTQNAAFDNIPFLFVAASDHVTPVTGATGMAVTRSINAGSFGAGTGTLAEIGNGMYQYDASAADMNGGIIIFRFTATGGTPGAPDDVFVPIVTGGGV